jgi:mRNA interferase HigB
MAMSQSPGAFSVQSRRAIHPIHMTARVYQIRHSKRKSALPVFFFRVVEQQEWSTPNDVRNTYRSADPVGAEFVVFDICKNDYRLVVRVDYKRLIVYIWDIYTHAAYDELDLKKLDEKISRERKQREPKRRDQQK